MKFAVLLVALALTSGSAFANSVVDAAERGDVNSVREQLRSGADVNEAHPDGMTSLHWAAERGDADLAKILIYAGANIAGGTRVGGYTPLHIASKQGHADVVTALLKAGADANVSTNNSGATPLHLAAASPSADTVQVLLDGGSNIDATEGAWGQTPLVFAASANRLENVQVLLLAGADHSATSSTVDVVDMERGDQAANKRLAAVLAEFKNNAGGGADWLPQPSEVQGAIIFSREVQRKWPDVPDPSCEVRGDAASAQFSRAALPDRCEEPEEGESAEVAATREPDATPMSYGDWVGQWGGLTPLLHAVRQGNDVVVLALLDAGADIDQPSAGDNTTPLLMAAINGQFDLALKLLEHGADPNILSDAGTGPLFAVIERQWAWWSHYAHPVDYQEQDATHMEIVAALLEAGADPNVRLEKHLWYAEFTASVLLPAGLHFDGSTPFWRAAQALDVNAMRLLKEYGADTNVATRKLPKKKKPADYAEGEEPEEEIDHSGLAPVDVGGPFVYPVHLAAGAGYGNYFMAHAHRHAPDNWMPALRYLVEECGSDVNLRDANGYTPLHHAAARGDNEMIEYLIAKGADVKVVSRKGQTTADMANGPAERISPFPDTIELLVKLGAINNNTCVSC